MHAPCVCDHVGAGPKVAVADGAVERLDFLVHSLLVNLKVRCGAKGLEAELASVLPSLLVDCSHVAAHVAQLTEFTAALRALVGLGLVVHGVHMPPQMPRVHKGLGAVLADGGPAAATASEEKRSKTKSQTPRQSSYQADKASMLILPTTCTTSPG